VVFLMQENHSFDNYLGMLPVCGQPQDTSVLATIERQWNLPALTYRDANAATLADFLDPSVMSFAEPPELAAPANPAPGLVRGYQGQPVPPSPASTVPAGS
jgi:phospholipase C